MHKPVTLLRAFMFRMSEPNYAYERTGEVTARTRINPLVSRHGRSNKTMPAGILLAPESESNIKP